MIRKISKAVVNFCRDEQGAEGLEKLLIVAAVVLPLLGVLIVFRNLIGEWVTANWTTAKTAGDGTITTP